MLKVADGSLFGGAIELSQALVGGAIASLFGKGGGKPATPDEMNSLLDRILQGKSTGFFCSQFVVYVYQFVAEQNGTPANVCFPMSDAKAPPTMLASKLSHNRLVSEAGFVMPDER